MSVPQPEVYNGYSDTETVRRFSSMEDQRDDVPDKDINTVMKGVEAMLNRVLHTSYVPYSTNVIPADIRLAFLYFCSAALKKQLDDKDHPWKGDWDLATMILASFLKTDISNLSAMVLSAYHTQPKDPDAEPYRTYVKGSGGKF